MSVKYIITLSLLLTLCSCTSDKKSENFDFTTRFERSGGTETATYEDVIEFYQHLAEQYTSIAIYTMDKTDSDHPLHLVTFNPDRSFESEFSGDHQKNVLLINNGIHPGESDGIDASMMLLRDYAEGTISAPENTIVAVIPVYNIGGALNRNSTTRTNQNGPKAYGFRGNARNYDLNRDFIKQDTRNAEAFADIFRTVRPDLFIDNHVSNGADYQYTLTHLFTQHNKLGGDLGNYMRTSFQPQLEDSLQQKNWDITPYVNVFNRTPELGFSQFMDGPRYSTGYTTLFHTLGMMAETHMLKPYKQRVEGTYELMKSFIKIADHDTAKIKELRDKKKMEYEVGKTYPISWAIDSSKTTTLQFKGYEGNMFDSDITGAKRLQYDTEQPFVKEVEYFDHMKPIKTIRIPSAYVIPRGYWDVVTRLRANKVKVDMIPNDTVVTAEVYHINNYETVRSPYEGHYLHYNTKVSTTTEEITVQKGDYIVQTQQEGVRYILETLEPEASDSFFNWNYFDAILQQKEGFSPYVWEDKAAEFLNENPSIKTDFEEKKANDPNFANNWFAQLDWIHKKSSHYEKAHLRYPIIRVGG